VDTQAPRKGIPNLRESQLIPRNLRDPGNRVAIQHHLGCIIALLERHLSSLVEDYQEEAASCNKKFMGEYLFVPMFALSKLERVNVVEVAECRTLPTKSYWQTKVTVLDRKQLLESGTCVCIYEIVGIAHSQNIVPP
jgi:hypothetical protein